MACVCAPPPPTAAPKPEVNLRRYSITFSRIVRFSPISNFGPLPNVPTPIGVYLGDQHPNGRCATPAERIESPNEDTISSLAPFFAMGFSNSPMRDIGIRMLELFFGRLKSIAAESPDLHLIFQLWQTAGAQAQLRKPLRSDAPPSGVRPGGFLLHFAGNFWDIPSFRPTSQNEDASLAWTPSSISWAPLPNSAL